MKGAKDFQELVHYQLVQALEELFKEVGWETYSSAAHEAGIYGTILYDVMSHKRGFLTHRDINHLLQAAMTRKLSAKRYWYWYEKLHKIVIHKDVLPALYYDNPNPRSDDIAGESFDQQTHNTTVNQALGKDPQFLQQIVDRFYIFGETTWSVTGVSLLLAKLKRGADLSQLDRPSLLEIGSYIVFNPSDWIEWLDVGDGLSGATELLKDPERLIDAVTVRVSTLARQTVKNLIGIFYK